MLECRAKITDIIKEYMESEGYQLSEASRFSHSLDAFHYNYQNAGGNRDMIKIELNYSLRAHIFEPVYRSILPETFDDSMKIRMVDPMEIFVAKGNALITRAAARDRCNQAGYDPDDPAACGRLYVCHVDQFANSRISAIFVRALGRMYQSIFGECLCQCE